MATFEIHKICPHLARQPRRRHVIANQSAQLIVRPHLRVVRHLEFCIQDRMPVSDARLVSKLFIRPTKPSRMRQLKPHRQIICASKLLAMRRQQNFPQFRKIAFRISVDEQLIRICPSIRPHRHRLRAANQLRPTLPKPPPTPPHRISHAPVRRAIPPLHRLQRNAVADRFTVNCNPRQSLPNRRGLGNDDVVARNLHPQGSHVRAECFRRF